MKELTTALATLCLAFAGVAAIVIRRIDISKRESRYRERLNLTAAKASDKVQADLKRWKLWFEAFPTVVALGLAAASVGLILVDVGFESNSNPTTTTFPVSTSEPNG